MITGRSLLFVAAALMLIDAVGYSLGALGPLQQSLRPSDAYLSRRLRLNLLLANQGLYFGGIAALLGAYFINKEPEASRAVEALGFLTCVYTVITVPALTPSDWRHTVPRAFAAALILGAWAVR